LRDYFKYDVQYVMNITDLDDKVLLSTRGRGGAPPTAPPTPSSPCCRTPQIILRARRQHLFQTYAATFTGSEQEMALLHRALGSSLLHKVAC
jgi:cysteinyl-tRNA synthetase